MSTIQEIEAAIQMLPDTEVKDLREWFDDFVEDRLELSDGVKAALDRAEKDVKEGRYRIRQTPVI